MFGGESRDNHICFPQFNVKPTLLKAVSDYPQVQLGQSRLPTLSLLHAASRPTLFSLTNFSFSTNLLQSSRQRLSTNLLR